jgi:uncharacterized protein YciI
MKYVMAYDVVSNYGELAPQLFPEHLQRLKEFHARGVLLMAGSILDGEQPAALGVFTSRRAAEEFAMGDPFVQQGVVTSWSVREWNEVLAT